MFMGDKHRRRQEICSTGHLKMCVERKEFQPFKNKWVGGFPGGTVVKNLPANAGDTGLIPVPGRSHIPRINEARVPQLLSLGSRACEQQLLRLHAASTEACVPRAGALQQEKLKPPQMRSPCTAMKSSPCSPQLERKPMHSNEDPMQPK